MEIHAASDDETVVITDHGRVFKVAEHWRQIAETDERHLQRLLSRNSPSSAVDGRPTKPLPRLIAAGDGDLRSTSQAMNLGCIAADVKWFDFKAVTDAVEQAGQADQRAPLVTLSSSFDYETLALVDDLCAELNIQWAPFHLELGRAFFGPFCHDAQGVRYRDLLLRRMCAIRDERLIAGLFTPPIAGDPVLPSGPALSWLLGAFWSEVGKWLGTGQSSAVEAEVELSPASLEMRRHAVLPRPDRPDARVTGAHQPADLVDNRTGIVTKVYPVRFHASVPSRLRVAQSEVADMARAYSWAPNIVNAGSSIKSYDEACQVAVGEAVERYCGNAFDPERFTLSTYDDLRSSGKDAIDPAKLELFSPAQYETPGFPFLPFSRDLPVNWITGQSLVTGKEVAVPASMVYVNWYYGDYSDEAPVTCPYYPGIAAGVSLEAALVSAIEEIIERDAMMTWWLGGDPLPSVALDGSMRAVAELLDEPSVHDGQRTWVLAVPNVFGAPVAASVVHHETDRLLFAGFACKPTLDQAACKAFAEAFGLQETARDVQNPKGSFWRLTKSGLGSQSLKPWRSDRRYLKSYAPDYRDVDNLYCQIQVYLDPAAEQQALPLIAPQGELQWNPSADLGNRTLPVYRELLQAQGFDAVFVDLTTVDVAAAGLRVVRVVVPGLTPNFPAAFPPLGHGRVHAVGRDLGWRGEFRTELGYNNLPLPYA